MAKSRNQILKKRYHYYRSLGYSAEESNKLKHQSLDITGFKLKNRTKGGKKTNKIYIVKNNPYYAAGFNGYINKYGYGNTALINDSVYTDWGYLTRVKPHNNETLKLAHAVAKREDKPLEWGYYYVYYAWLNGKTDKEMKEIIKVDKSFEIYVKKGTLR